MQHAAEPAGLIPDPLNLGARPLRRTDDSGSSLVDDVDHLVELFTRHGHLRERGYLLEVPEPGLDAELHLFASLLFGLGDMEQSDQAPVLAVDLGAEGRRAFF